MKDKTPLTTAMLLILKATPEYTKEKDTDRDRVINLARQLETAKNENWAEVLDWERWAKEVCEDFRIPFDNHKVGLRAAITQWMAERKHSNSY